MPCTLTGSLEGDRRLALEETVQERSRTITKLTQYLCKVGKSARAQGFFEKLPLDVKWFLEKHEKLDAKRAKKKRKAKQ